MNKCIEIIAEETKKDDSLEKIRIVSGTARGADKLGEQYAQIAHYEVSRFEANWDCTERVLAIEEMQKWQSLLLKRDTREY